MADDDGRSVMSDTDRMVFTVLSNPERIDLSNLPTLRHETESRIEELPRIEEEETTHRRDAERRPDSPDERRDREDAGTSEDDRRDRHDRSAEEGRDDADYAAEDRDDDRRPDDRHERPAEARDAEPEAAAPADDEDERRTLLLDLRRLEVQGIKLSKDFTMEDRTEDMLLEIRRHTLAMDEASQTQMMRDMLKLFVTGVEMMNNRIGLLDLEGWSSEVVRDMHKHDANLSRIYRKYWRRSTSTSPEVDICLSLAGSMGMWHMKRKMSQHLMSGAAGGGAGFGAPRPSRRPPPAARRVATPPTSDDEAPP